MASRSTVVHIPTPCAESWDAMTPTGPGRHCAACKKTVVDFSQKTDAEILAILAKAVGGETCGRFRAEQLAVALVPPASASRWRTWLGAVLAVGGMLGASRAAAQTASSYYSGGPVPTVASPGGVAATAPLVAPATPAAPANPGEPVVLQGVVADAQTGEHLPGVTVLLKGTQQGISTDKDGQFALSIPAGDVATATITFSYIGYITAEMPAARVAATPVVAIQVSDHIMLGGLEVIYVQKPWPWHPRSFFNWGKYWLTKPFRE